MDTDMNITPVRKVNAVDEVFDQMQSLLIEGIWKPGEKLPSENELSQTFAVSRMTIRQAMQKLKALGLIETRTGSGSFVREVSPDDCLQDLIPLMFIGDNSQLQVFQFREMIESESVRIATPLVTEENLNELEKICQKMQEDAESGDDGAFSADDFRFHTLLVKFSSNPLIIRAYQILAQVLDESMQSVIKAMKYSSALDYHSRIINAMRKRDAALAEKLTREHIRQNYSFFQSETP